MRRSPRLIGTVALLILALVVAAVLAYQAWDAAQVAEANGGEHAQRLRQVRRLAADAAGEECAAHPGRHVADLGPAIEPRPGSLLADGAFRRPKSRTGAPDDGDLVQLSFGRAVFLPLRLARRDVPHDRNRPARRRPRLGARHDGRVRQVRGPPPDREVGAQFGSPGARSARSRISPSF